MTLPVTLPDGSTAGAAHPQASPGTQAQGERHRGCAIGRASESSETEARLETRGSLFENWGGNWAGKRTLCGEQLTLRVSRQHTAGKRHKTSRGRARTATKTVREWQAKGLSVSPWDCSPQDCCGGAGHQPKVITSITKVATLTALVLKVAALRVSQKVDRRPNRGDKQTSGDKGMKGDKQ